VEGNTFYHPDLKFKFSFPSGWKLENSPIQVRIVPSDGKALTVFGLANQNSLQESAQYTLEQLELNVIESRQTTVNGLPAIVAVSQQSVENQSTGAVLTNIVLSYFIEYEGRYYVFHGVSADADFPAYRNSLEISMKSFSRLTDPAKLNVKPKRLVVRQAPRSSTLAGVFSSLGVPQAMMADLALLNNLELTDQVQAGKLIKIIQ